MARLSKFQREQMVNSIKSMDHSLATSKTISVGGEVGSNGLRFSVSVEWMKVGFMQSKRFLTVKVGAYEVYREEEFSEPERRAACAIITAMLATSEPDLCKYLTRALMEVEL